jgi:predicted nucleotidyltransferase
MKFGLKEDTIEKISGVLMRVPNVEQAILYGSRAKGNFKNGSDIDLTLIGDRLDLSVLNSIRLAIDDLLLPYSIDISIYQQIDNPDLIDHIKRVGIVFYRKNDRD